MPINPQLVLMLKGVEDQELKNLMYSTYRHNSKLGMGIADSIRYERETSDFIGKNFIVECKGLITDSFPLRFKLFKRYLKQHRSNFKVYLVRNHAQVDEMIKEIINDKQSTLCQNS